MIADPKLIVFRWFISLALTSLIILGCQKKSETAQTDRPDSNAVPSSAAIPEQDSIVDASDSDLSPSPSASANSNHSRMLGEDQQREIVGQLVALGLGSQASDSLFASISADSTQALEFSQSDVEFDGKPGKEKISWWGFQSGLGDAIQRIYWLVVSKGDAPAKSLAYYLIILPYCDASEQGTAALKLSPWENQIQQILIEKNQSLSCGGQLAGAQQTDTLRFISGQILYREGKNLSTGETDKMEIPE